MMVEHKSVQRIKKKKLLPTCDCEYIHTVTAVSAVQLFCRRSLTLFFFFFFFFVGYEALVRIWRPDLSPGDGLRLALSPLLFSVWFLLCESGVNKVSSCVCGRSPKKGDGSTIIVYDLTCGRRGLNCMCSGSARVWEQLCSPGEPNSGLKVPRSPSDALSDSPSRPLDSGSDRW